MDYEKKYNEALERARKIHNEILDNEILGFPDQIREIFPELRGSEDERIRKWLADYFSSIKKTVWIFRDITCEQILAYLEKQKEQKPAAWSEEDKKILDDVSHILIGLNYKQIAKDYKQAVEKLIYARPSWKPSEEQMSMLRAIVNDPNNVGAESCHLAMQSLYNDLLKLK